MSTLATQAEITKLSRLLGCPEAQLSGLTALPTLTIRQMREACVSTLFDGDKGAFQKIAASTKLMPGPLVALIAEKAMGPLLCARVSGLLPPKDAVDTAKRLGVPFLTEVTILLDPRRAAPMLQLMPLEIIVKVSEELTRRHDYVTMARFVEVLPNAAIEAVMKNLAADALLRSGALVETSTRLEEVIGILSDTRLSELLAVAAQPDLHLSAASMAMMETLGPSMRARLITAAINHPNPAVLKEMKVAMVEHSMQAVFAPGVALLPPSLQEKVGL